MRKKVTQKDRVLKYINDFGSISSFDAFADLGITRLSAVIFDLRELGYKIKSNSRTGTNRYGEKVYYTKYTLEKESN